MVTLRIPVWFMQRSVQRGLALATLVALAASHTLLSRLPLPVEVDSLGRFETGTGSELVIDQALAQPSPFLVFEGEMGDAVDLRFDRARLQENSARLLERLGVGLPMGEHAVSLLTGQADAAKTFLRVDVIPVPGQASRITLRSPREAGDSGLALVLRADGARLAVSVLSTGDATPDAPPPQRTLRLGGQVLPRLSGAVPLAILAASGSEIRLRIVPTVHGWAEVQRLALAPAEPHNAALTAFGLGIRAGQNGEFSDYACATGSHLPLASPGRLAEGRCTEDTGKLRLISLGLRPGQVSVQASGLAWVRKDDAVHTLDLVAWLKQNPILATLIGALDAAVLAWCKRVFFGGGPGRFGGQGPDEGTHPHHPPEVHP